MSCVAEFGINVKFEKDKDYSSNYEPQKYNCVAIGGGSRLTHLNYYK